MVVLLKAVPFGRDVIAGFFASREEALAYAAKQQHTCTYYVPELEKAQ